jgi:hypothetical protein
VVSSVHFLIRQAARERLAAVRTLSQDAKQRHLAMAELYERRAAELGGGAPSQGEMDAKIIRFGRKRG